MKKRISLLIMMLVAVIGIVSLMSIVAYADEIETAHLTFSDSYDNVASFPADKGNYTLPTYAELEFTVPDGYRFIAWEIGGEEKYPGDEIIITEDLNINAIWEEIRYTISFSSGEGTGSKEPGQWGTSEYDFPEHVGFNAPDGKEFAGWSIEGDTEGTLYPERHRMFLTSDITLVANWKLKTYTVTFSAGAGTGEMSPAVGVEHGSEYEIPECTFTAPEGMEFAGWSIDGQPAPNVTNIIDNVTIVATWQTITYTVSFDAGEGSGAMSGEEIAPNGTFTLPTCELNAPEGYQFKCWSVGGEEKEVGAEITVTNDVTVVAVWEKKTYTITLSRVTARQVQWHPIRQSTARHISFPHLLLPPPMASSSSAGM